MIAGYSACLGSGQHALGAESMKQKCCHGPGHQYQLDILLFASCLPLHAALLLLLVNLVQAAKATTHRWKLSVRTAME
jgi:hypothetical protein